MEQAQAGDPAMVPGSQRARSSSSISLRIRFMGVIAALTGSEQITLDFDRSRTLRELLYDLEARYGPEFGARIFRCAAPPRRLQMGLRLFINKKLIDEASLEHPLPLPPDGAQSSEVLIYFLPAACGG